MTMRAAGRPSVLTVAATHAVPLVWNGSAEDLPSSIADILRRAKGDHDAGRAPSAICALAAIVDARFRGKGMSAVAVRAMVDVGRTRGLRALIAPLRPADKSLYPLAPMNRYVRWTNEDGLPLDPWIRGHARLGPDILGVLPRAL